jgi:peptide-methionine (S)-S-oxide reductase
MAKSEKITFGAGCFWGAEAAFGKLKGVKSTAVGYMGGSRVHPTYQQVCGGLSGHAEVVQVSFDSDVVSFKSLLDTFWEIHNPTTLNRQGLDIGKQYRSVIFYHNEEQHRQVLEFKKLLEEEKRYNKPIITEILPAGSFYNAEDYHQQYYKKKGISSNL